MALTHDVLDCESGRVDRWCMNYRDGRQRRSQYRWDLILDRENTAVTKAAFVAWPDCRFPLWPTR